MNDKIESKLANVPETMLITLWAKATETGRTDALIKDEKAVEMMGKIDYDFSKLKKASFSQSGCCVRAGLIDMEAKAFLKDNPDAVVIQLGAGIDARYERLGKPKVSHWYDLDLPEAIELRRKLLQESEENTFLPQSLLDYSWCDKVKAAGKPILIIIEGVMMYFEPEAVKSFFTNIAQRLDNAVVLFDMLAFSLVGKSKVHDSLKKMDKEVEFKWSVLNTKEMETWSNRLHLDKEYYMSDHDHGRFPFIFRMLYHIPYFYRHFNQRVVKLKIGQ